MANPGTPYIYGGTDFTFDNTGVRGLNVHPICTQLSSELTVFLSLLEGRASNADGVVQHWLTDEDGSVEFDTGLAFGADFAEAAPEVETKDYNLVHKIRKSVTLSQETLKDTRLGPAQDQKMRQANKAMRKLTRNTCAALYWSNRVEGDEITGQRMRGAFEFLAGQSMSASGATTAGGAYGSTFGATVAAGTSIVDSVAFSEDNIIKLLLEPAVLSDAGFPLTDVIFPQNAVKHVNTFSGFYGTTNAQVLRGSTGGPSRGGAVTTYDQGYGQQGGPVSFHFERGTYLDVDTTNLGGGSPAEHILGIHAPLWELRNFEPATAFWRDPMAVGAYRWHFETYRTLTLLARAGYQSGRALTNLSGIA